jgi:Apea-like HEPN
MAITEYGEPAEGIAARIALGQLVKDTVQMGQTAGLSLSELQGTALYDMTKDEKIQALESFATAASKAAELPRFVESFGAGEAPRIARQFVYQYFKHAHVMSYSEEAFECTYDDLLNELESPVWVFRGVANVRFFTSDVHHVDLDDGITIRGRSRADLASLGFGTSIWNGIAEDWSGFGASSFVLVAEHSILKKPDNLILVDSYQLSVKAMRAILALRLCGEGSVGIGPMWVIRPARFNVGIGGISRAGASIPTMGTSFRWTPTMSANYSAIYDGVKLLEEEGFKASPGNLSVALRSFSSTYDRWPTAQDSQLLDCVTALEALLGADNEITFKLSFRVASILAESDEERTNLLKVLKDFYDTRSKVIHGASLKAKHQTLLQRVEELRNIVRRLLIAFIRLGNTKPAEYGKNFWQEKLDGALVNTVERGKLRVALGLAADRLPPSDEQPKSGSGHHATPIGPEP